MPDQRSLLRGRLASVIDGVADVAAQLTPPAARPAAPPPPPAPPGRAWTLALAMEPIAALPIASVPAADSAPPSAPSPSDAGPRYEPPSHHRFPAVVIGSGLVGVILAVSLGLRLLPSPAHPAPANVPSPVALTAVRPVAAPARVGGAVPATQVSFPSGTSTVSIEVDAATAARQAPVEIMVSVGQPAATIIDNNYILNSSGATLIPLSPATGGFPAGDYTVTISGSGDGTTLGTTAFEVR